MQTQSLAQQRAQSEANRIARSNMWAAQRQANAALAEQKRKEACIRAFDEAKHEALVADITAVKFGNFAFE